MTFAARIISSIAVLLVLAISSVSGSDIKPPVVPRGHPRVYVRPDDLPEIKAKLHEPEFTASWATVRESKHPLCQAFVYLTAGQKEKGRSAIANALRELKQCTDARTPNNAMHWGACVYDWCYDLLLPKEKNQFIAEFKRIAASHHPGYPANPNGHAVVGHGTEGWLLTDQLPAGLAIYDDSPEMFDAAAQLFFTKFLPVRNFFYPAHMHHQGDSYIATRFQHDLLASWLFRRIRAGDVFTRQQQFVAYQLIYHHRPDGQQLRSGDTYDCSGRSNSKRRLMLLAGTYYNDPYLLEMADSDFYQKPSFFDRVFELLFRKSGLPKRPVRELPRSKYFPPPMGEMVARTGWRLGLDSESRDAVVHMRIGEYFFGNHQRKDFGTFQIYYRGPLAIASGIYQGQNQPYGSPHWLHYHHQTAAHNGLLIYDPSERMAKGAVNDGGQRWPNDGADHPKDLQTLLEKDYRMGGVSAHEFGPSPTIPLYSYIAGDITPAYASSKVEKVTRSMVTFNTRHPVWPCIFIVFDRVVSTNPAFKKTWLLHSIQEPVIQGRKVILVRDGKQYTGKGQYAGKLVVESLLPEQVNITKVGGPGKEFWIESVGKNFATSKGGAAEPGNWRIEVSPKRPAKSDTFFHVLTVTDNTTPKGPPVREISSESLIGAEILNFAVLFGRTGELLQKADFVLDGPALAKMLICDLMPGLWSVTRDGEQITTARATDEGRCIYLEAIPGSYCLRLLTSQPTFLNFVVTFVGGYRPGWSRLRRNPGFQLLHEADVRSEVGQEYSVALAVRKGRLRYYINGRLVHDVRDPQPLPGGRFGIRTWSTNAWWDDVEFGHLIGTSE